MKFSKAFNLFALFLFAKLISVCIADQNEQLLGDLQTIDLEVEKVRQQKKLILVSSLAATVALLVGSALGYGIFSIKHSKKGDKDEEKKGGDKEDKGTGSGSSSSSSSSS